MKKLLSGLKNRMSKINLDTAQKKIVRKLWTNLDLIGAVVVEIWCISWDTANFSRCFFQKLEKGQKNELQNAIATPVKKTKQGGYVPKLDLIGALVVDIWCTSCDTANLSKCFFFSKPQNFTNNLKFRKPNKPVNGYWCGKHVC